MGILRCPHQAHLALIEGQLCVEVVQGDITKDKSDAIVNAANSTLQHLDGVAHALSEAGGPQIQNECNAFIRLKGIMMVGKCISTKAGKLNAKYVLHAHGPVWRTHEDKDSQVDLLSSAIMSALKEADENLNCKSISIPAVSSGKFKFPKALCAETFFDTIKKFSDRQSRH